MKQEIWLSDLTKFRPTNAISFDRGERTWIAVNYEVDEGKGVMLFGLPDLNPPSLTLRLKVTDWHEIRLGIFYGSGAAFIKDRVLCAKLSDDITFSRLSREYYRSGKDGMIWIKNLAPLISLGLFRFGDLRRVGDDYYKVFPLR